MRKLYIVGLGLGHESLLTPYARACINASVRVLNSREIPISGIFNELAAADIETTTVIVSGDCGFFSISQRIIDSFSDRYDIEVINGISSVQYLAAKMRITYDDAVFCSMHGRDGRILPKVCYNKKVFALTGGRYRAHDICKTLTESGLGSVPVTIGENLSLENEQIYFGTAEVFSSRIFNNLSIICVQNPSAQNPNLPLRDSSFIRGDIPMTKEDVRWLSIQKLEINDSDILYDIGAGTGSVAIEMARKAYNGYVYAFEMNECAIELVSKNRQEHGAFNVFVNRATAPDFPEGLPIPDKVFIGGSSGNFENIVINLIDKNPSAQFVANCVTLQSLTQIIQTFENLKLVTETTCVNISKSKKMGRYDLMTAQNPVYIISAKRGETNG